MMLDIIDRELITMYYSAYSAALSRRESGRPAMSEYEGTRLRQQLMSIPSALVNLQVAGSLDLAYASGATDTPSGVFEGYYKSKKTRHMTLSDMLKLFG